MHDTVTEINAKPAWLLCLSHSRFNIPGGSIQLAYFGHMLMPRLLGSGRARTWLFSSQNHRNEVRFWAVQKWTNKKANVQYTHKPLEEAYIGTATWRAICHYVVELIYVFYDAEIPFLGTESGLKFPHNVHKETCLSMFTEALSIIMKTGNKLNVYHFKNGQDWVLLIFKS